LTPLLTAPASPEILYGYGDPSVLRIEDGPDRGWWLVVTSNDAPEVFPILRSDDLRTWRPAGFVFPEGRTPAWSLNGEHRADFWAPEMHWVGDEVWVCFAAREHDRSLAVGLARAPGPGGPFTPDPAPLVGGGVIDPHLVLDRQRAPWLLWKRDDNDLWPGLLANACTTNRA
jgi:beta-xylosidase